MGNNYAISKQTSYSVLSKATGECGILIQKAKASFPVTIYVLCIHTHTHTYIYKYKYIF